MGVAMREALQKGVRLVPPGPVEGDGSGTVVESSTVAGFRSSFILHYLTHHNRRPATIRFLRSVVIIDHSRQQNQT